jgi:pimeloyl-ACP methyl ester carboxylesterase
MPQIRANGIDIAYESAGRDSDPAILLIHGLNTPLTGWPDSLVSGLAARGFRVISFDNRDVGLSIHLAQLGAPDIAAMMAKLSQGEAAPAPYSLEDMAEDAAGQLAALGVARAHIVGASMGGMIAQLVAINHPASAKSLVSMMSTTARRGLPDAKPEAMRAMLAVPASSSREDRMATALAAVKAAGGPAFATSDEERRAYLGRSIDRTPYDPPAAARQLAAVIAAKPRNESLSRLALPALVIHGADDPVIPLAHGEDTARSIPGAELLAVLGLGHDFTEKAARLYLEAIGGFVAKVEVKERAAA